MRGVTSYAMVMCACSPECVELLDPPSGSVPGDKVVCEGYSGTPDEQLNPKRKVRLLMFPKIIIESEFCQSLSSSVGLTLFCFFMLLTFINFVLLLTFVCFSPDI